MAKATKKEQARQHILAWIERRLAGAEASRQTFRFDARHMFSEIHPITVDLAWSQSTTSAALSSLVKDVWVTMPDGTQGTLERAGKWYLFKTRAKLKADEREEREWKKEKEAKQAVLAHNRTTTEAHAKSIERSFARAGLTGHIAPWSTCRGGNVQITLEIEEAAAYAKYMEACAR
jgi:hypothetical protein